MSTFNGTVTSHCKEERTVYVMKRPVHIKPGCSHEGVERLTEAELSMIVDDPDLDLEGRVRVVRFKNYREVEELGVFDAEDERDVPVDDVVVEVTDEAPDEELEDGAEDASTDEPVDAEDAPADEPEEGAGAPEDLDADAPDEGADETPQAPEKLDAQDPKDGAELLEAVKDGYDIQEVQGAFHKPAFERALETLGLEPDGNKDELAERLVTAVRGG